MNNSNLKTKTVSTLDLRKKFGELTNQVIYGNTVLKVTKNKDKAFVILPLEHYREYEKQEKNPRKQNLINKFRQLRANLNKRNLKIDGLSWSEFIKQERKSH